MNLSKKAVAAAAHQVVTAEGTTDVSTNSSTYVDIPDMELEITTTGGKVLINFNASLCWLVAGVDFYILILRNGTEIGGAYQECISESRHISVFLIDDVSAGTYTYKVQWHTQYGDTITNYGTKIEGRRRLTAIELA